MPRYLPSAVLALPMAILLASCQTVPSGCLTRPLTDENLQSVVEYRPGKVLQPLSGVGINAIGYWSGAGEGYVEDRDIDLMVRFGFEHIVFVVNIDKVFNLHGENPVLKTHAAKRLMDRLAQQIRKAVKRYPDMHFVVAFKSKEGGRPRGKWVSTLHQYLEKNEAFRGEFITAWRIFAESTRDIPEENLIFNLLNEPEFEVPWPTSSKRNIWLRIATDAVDAIRVISPKRTIIIEGIGKSLFAKRYFMTEYYRYDDVDELIKTIERGNIVYGFHSYQPESFTQQGMKWARMAKNYKKPFASWMAEQIESDAKRLGDWARRQNVPVVLAEFGAVGYIKNANEGPASFDDRAKFAAAVRQAYGRYGIGVTWWSYEKEKTIFQRDYVKSFIPRSRKPDMLLFEALGLDPYC